MKADTLFSAQRVRAGLRWQCRGSLWQGDDITLRLRSPQDVPIQAARFASVPLQTVWFVCRCLSITHHRTAGCQYWAKFLTSPLLSRCMAADSAIPSPTCVEWDTQLFLLDLQAQQGTAAAPLVAAAGTDISHWYMPCYLMYILRRTYTCAADMAYTLRFDAKTGDIKLFVDLLTNVQSAYCPQVCTVCTCVLHSMQLEGA